MVSVDALFWQPGWVVPDGKAWEEAHRRALAGESWVADGNFDSTLAERLAWADTIVLPGHGLDTTLGTESPHLQEWVDRGW